MGQQGKNKMLNREFAQGLELQLAAGRRLAEREEGDDILKNRPHIYKICTNPFCISVTLNL